MEKKYINFFFHCFLQRQVVIRYIHKEATEYPNKTTEVILGIPFQNLLPLSQTVTVELSVSRTFVCLCLLTLNIPSGSHLLCGKRGTQSHRTKTLDLYSGTLVSRYHTCCPEIEYFCRKTSGGRSLLIYYRISGPRINMQ